MNQLRVKKELRMLSPYWRTAAVLLLGGLLLRLAAVTRFLGPFRGGWIEFLYDIVPYLVLSGAAFAWQFMSASLFTGEFVHGTAAQLLAQPAPRAQIWAEKMTAFLLASLPLLLLVALLWQVEGLDRSSRADRPGLLASATFSMFLAAAFVTPLLALKDRQYLVPTVCGFMAPASLLLLVSAFWRMILLQSRVPDLPLPSLLYWGALAAACFGGLFLSRRAFIRAEITPSRTMALANFSARFLPSRARSSAARSRAPWVVQLSKELRELSPLVIFGLFAIAGWAVIQVLFGALVGPQQWTLAFQYVPLVSFLWIGYIVLHAVAVQPFSSEFDNGTWSFSLAQPAGRLRLGTWKLIATATAMLLLLAFGGAAAGAVARLQTSVPQFQPYLLGAFHGLTWNGVRAFWPAFAGLALFIFCTAPLIALLLRRRTALLVSAATPLLGLILMTLYARLWAALIRSYAELPVDVFQNSGPFTFWLTPIFLALMLGALTLGILRFRRLQV